MSTISAQGNFKKEDTIRQLIKDMELGNHDFVTSIVRMGEANIHHIFC